MFQKRHWLKGGITALGINIFLSLAGVIISFSTHDISDAYGIIAEKVFNFFAAILLYLPLGKEGFQFPELFIISLGFWFLIGASFGCIYGKIKEGSKIDM